MDQIGDFRPDSDQFWDHHQIDSRRRRDLRSENLSNQSFSTIPVDGPADLAAGDNPKPRDRRGRWGCHDREIAAVRSPAAVEDVLELRPPAETPARRQRKTHGDFSGYRECVTASRLRPLARRRFKTWRPFFVDIRTRNPWVFFRRRRFG